MNEFVVYVLFSKKFNKIYTGYTSDLINRFYSHNIFSKSGYTFKFRPWEIVYVEFFESKSDALKREKALKSSQGRKFIHEKIKRIE